MRRLPVLLFLAAACGDFSNDAVDDLSFVQALPRAEDLRLAAEEEGVVATSADGLATSARGLRICSRTDAEEPICTGVRLARSIDTVTAAVLLTLDAVRGLPPTERARHLRVWGPFPEAERGRESRVVVERHEARDGWSYAWRVDVRAPGSNAWIRLLVGAFSPGRGGAASRGAGHFAWLPADARAAGLEAIDATERLEIRYDLRGPVRVEADADFDRQRRDDLPSKIAFEQDAAADGSGAWRYAYPWDVNGEGAPDEVEVRARWRADRAGRSDARLRLRGGLLDGAVVGSETCWDASFERTFFRSDDPRQCAGGVCPEGDEASCAFPALFADP